MVWYCTRNIPGTNSTHCNSGVLKFHAPDVFRVIAVPSEAVPALAKAASSLRSPEPCAHMRLCKGKRSQMTSQLYLVNLLCYGEYSWVWSSLELCSKRRKGGHLKCFVIPLSLGAKILISGSKEFWHRQSALFCLSQGGKYNQGKEKYNNNRKHNLCFCSGPCERHGNCGDGTGGVTTS